MKLLTTDDTQVPLHLPEASGQRVGFPTSGRVIHCLEVPGRRGHSSESEYEENELKRRMEILKMRGTSPTRGVQRYQITDNGLELAKIQGVDSLFWDPHKLENRTPRTNFDLRLRCSCGPDRDLRTSMVRPPEGNVRSPP